jgi:leucine-rich repeat/coiled-coil domain-containing protein 1
MVSQIESLTEEVQILKEKLKNEEDCRKIKEKIIADQSDTISKLKQELVERDKEFHSELDQCRQERSAVQDHMEEMSMENQDLQVGLSWVVGLMDVVVSVFSGLTV